MEIINVSRDVYIIHTYLSIKYLGNYAMYPSEIITSPATSFSEAYRFDRKR